jgi:HEAT repeat protein
VLEVMTGDRPASDILSQLPDRERSYFVGFLSQFIRRVRGPERRHLLDLAQPLLPTVRAQLTSRSAEVRARAVDTLGLLSRPGETAELVAALDDPSPLVAMVAARALTRERSPEHAVVIVRHLHRFQLWRPSYLAAMLAAFGPEIGPALREALADTREAPRTRAVAAAALTRLNDATAAAVAHQVLTRESDAMVLASVLRLLAKVGHAAHLPGIRAKVGAPEDDVRLAAVLALGALGDATDVPLLRVAIHDPSRWVAEHAARGLAAGAGREVLRSVIAEGGAEALIAREALEQATS